MERVINPYNFIPFREDIDQHRHSREEEYQKGQKLVSGWINVELTTKTPLIIPDGAQPVYIDPETQEEVTIQSEKEKKKYHKVYDFMKRCKDETGEQEYYIPGSSIRGMIRSVYEAVTNSCVPFLLTDKPISKRVPLYSSLHKRGLLEYDKENKQWILYSAMIVQTDKAYVKEKSIQNRYGKTESMYYLIGKTGSEFPKTGTNEKQKDKTVHVIQYNIPVKKEEEYHVVRLQKSNIVHKWKEGDDEPYRLLNSVLYRDDVKGKQNNPNRQQFEDLRVMLEKAKRGEKNLVPVYYFIVTRKHEGYNEELVYLSNSAAGRIAQKRKWVDIMAEYGPCKDINKGEKGLCPACLLFGTLGDKIGLKSRVRITDATSRDELQFEKKTLDILGEPRSSAFEYYLERPQNAAYWNFDFYSVSEEDENGKSHTNYYDMDKAMPRGRKMYWHGKPVEGYQKKKMNSTMESVSNARFQFKVYVDRITEEQLKALLWTITLGENKEDSNYQHKLGHAKPLGYGSVKMVVTGGKIRTVSRGEDGVKVSQEDLTVPENYDGNLIDMDSKQVLSVLKMSDASVTEGYIVSYPIGSDNSGRKAIYQWFSENRVNAKTLKTLPHVLDEDITLESDVSTQQRRAGKASGKPEFTNKRYTYKKGDEYKGIIDHYAVNGNLAIIIIDDGKQIGVFYKNTYKGFIPYGQMEDYFPEGVKVKVSYRGEERLKSGKIQQVWEILEAFF